MGRKRGIPRLAGVSSFGVGGTNAHIILEESPIRRLSEGSRDKFHYTLLPLSAKKEWSLEEIKQNLKKYISSTPEVTLSDIAYTYQIGRETFAHRYFFLFRDKKQFLEGLEKPLSVNHYYHLKDNLEKSHLFVSWSRF